MPDAAVGDVGGVDDEDDVDVHDRNVPMGFHKVIEESSLSVSSAGLDQGTIHGAYRVFGVQAVYDQVEFAFPHLALSCLYPMVISS